MNSNLLLNLNKLEVVHQPLQGVQLGVRLLQEALLKLLLPEQQFRSAK